MTKDNLAHFNVTVHPTAAWTAQQMVEAFPLHSAPRYVIRDRDGIYGSEYRSCVHSVGIDEVPEVPTAPRSPWQNPYAEE